MLGVELGANTSYTVSSPWNSFATNRALIPSFLWSRSQRVVTRFLPRTVRMSTVLHTPNSASRSGQQFSNVFVTVEEVCRVIILSSRYCDSSRCQTPSICEPSPSECLACARPVPWVRLLAWSVWTTRSVLLESTSAQ